MNKMNKNLEIMKIVVAERNGITPNQVMLKLEEKEIEYYWCDITLSMLVKRGLLRVDGKYNCDKCGKSAICYRVTDAGRIYLRSKGV